MNLQALIHWLEQGRGAGVLKTVALLLVIAALSATVAFKQFHGPRTEETLRQADLGRSIAAGEGFSTSVNHPQAMAVLTARGQRFDRAQRPPELYHPPGYAVTIAAALAVLPADTRAGLFDRVPSPPGGFGADYLLLVLNVGLLWVAAGQTWRLGVRWFDPLTGLVAALALLASTAVWAHVVAVDGTPLAMVLLLGLFQCLTAADRAVDEGRRAGGAWAGAGAVAGALFLTDYPLAVLVVVAAGFAGWRARWPAAFIVVGVALLVAAPWLVRNTLITGSPVGLAAQDLALRVNDPTADPEIWRTTLTADGPAPSLAKLGNKTLTALKETVQQRLWSGGGLMLTAFFVTGWIYRFRRAGTNRLRTVFAIALLAMVVGAGLMNSGEGERLPTTVAAPLIIVFGTGFFSVLVTSSEALRLWPRVAAGSLLVLQALPLLHDLAEPRRIHFSYPPYYPAFFRAMGDEMARRAGPVAGWMADVPAGAAWYSGQRVWAQPATLRDFYAVHVDQPMLSLVLTPDTLDRPFFAELAAEGAAASRFGDWGRVYTGLISGRMPREFPLREPRRLAENFYLLLDPAWGIPRGK